MPWPPGFTPVAKVDQATGVCAGVVVAISLKPPRAVKRARFGSSPRASRRRTIFGSRPSRPSAITLRIFKAPLGEKEMGSILLGHIARRAGLLRRTLAAGEKATDWVGQVVAKG